jgi:hypothetical protein
MAGVPEVHRLTRHPSLPAPAAAALLSIGLQAARVTLFIDGDRRTNSFFGIVSDSRSFRSASPPPEMATAGDSTMFRSPADARCHRGRPAMSF